MSASQSSKNNITSVVTHDSLRLNLDPVWKSIELDYELLEKPGEGSYGQVLKARHRETGRLCAIKHVKDALYDAYEAQKVLREIHIMRKLSSQK